MKQFDLYRALRGDELIARNGLNVSGFAFWRTRSPCKSIEDHEFVIKISMFGVLAYRWNGKYLYSEVTDHYLDLFMKD